MTEDDVAAVSRLHVETLDGTLAGLGKRVTETWYRRAVVSSTRVAYVAESDGELLGFVFGARHAPTLKQDIIRQGRVGLAFSLLLGAFAHPRAGWHVLSSNLASDVGYDTESPELLYLTVAHSARGKGVGQALVSAFDAVFGAEADAYQLSVEVENRAALRFYEKLGFQEIARYREFGSDYLRLSRGTVG